MRKIATIVCALALALVSLTGASASTNPGTTAVNCNHWSGGGILPISADYVRVGGTPTGYAEGAVQLCKSGADYWGYIVLYDQQLTGYWAQAGLYRIRNNVKIEHVNCDTPPLDPPRGGNGHVAPGQTQCWTKKLQKVDPADKFYVLGIDCRGTYPHCEHIYARGDTAVVA